MQHFSLATIQSWDRFYRANFINSLSGYKPVSLIGTTDAAGNYNLAVFSNIVHLGADPALIGFINRPKEAAPHTIANIEATGVYTINHIHPAFQMEAHQTSAKYPAAVSEFDATGLTPVVKAGIAAPFVGESQLQYALRLQEIVPITHNNTYLVIGAVTDVFTMQESIAADGLINLHQTGSMVSIGIDGYATVNEATRYAYAKP